MSAGGSGGGHSMSTGGKKIYHARLDGGERALLQGTVDGGKGSVTRRRRGRILLLADASRDGGGRDDADMADVPGAGASTGGRARRRFVPGAWRRLWRGRGRPTAGSPCWTAGARRGWRCWPAPSLPRGTRAGRCGCPATGSAGWRPSTASRRGRCGRGSYETLQVKCPFSKPHIGVPPSVGGRLPCHRGSPDRTSRFHDALNDASSLLSGSVGRCRPRDHYARFGRCDVPGGAGPI